MRPAEIAAELKVNRASVYRILKETAGMRSAESTQA
jgi:predicted DNA-binding protein YlxM (UPF0122 family)